MPWTKSGDNAATHPRLMRVDSDAAAEDWSLNEVAGFILRAYFQSAGHMTDYHLDYGMAKLLGNGRHEDLIALAERAGLLTLVSGRGRSRQWRLLEDPEFVHLMLRAEVEWNRQRDRDRRNDDLTIPVRRRDGDACRYCDQIVSWSARRGARAGTYDHLEPGHPATVDTYVVCCNKCNSTRKVDPDALTLTPPPAVPAYSPATVRHLLKAYQLADLPPHILLDPATDTASATPPKGPRAMTRPGADLAESQVPPEKGQKTRVDAGAPDAGSGRVGSGTGSGLLGSGLLGSGQVGQGQGQVGSGRETAPPPPASPPAPRRRGRRGRKP